MRVIGKVIRVSLETVGTVEGLPGLGVGEGEKEDAGLVSLGAAELRKIVAVPGNWITR